MKQDRKRKESLKQKDGVHCLLLSILQTALMRETSKREQRQKEQERRNGEKEQGGEKDGEKWGVKERR